jgi:hypothetical protein
MFVRGTYLSRKLQIFGFQMKFVSKFNLCLLLQRLNVIERQTCKWLFWSLFIPTYTCISYLKFHNEQAGRFCRPLSDHVQAFLCFYYHTEQRCTWSSRKKMVSCLSFKVPSLFMLAIFIHKRLCFWKWLDIGLGIPIFYISYVNQENSCHPRQLEVEGWTAFEFSEGKKKGGKKTWNEERN